MLEIHHFGGMHFFWWIVWVSILVWIFATPYNIPGQRVRRDTPLDLLKKRFASGEIDNEEYLEKINLLRQN